MTRNWNDKRILIADDEQINYLFLKAILKPTQANVLFANNCQEVIDICNDSKACDIILMDLKMPLIDGLEASRNLKSKFPHLPIIAQTAYAQEEDEQAAFAAGCDDYIAKPIRPDNLLTLLSKFLG